MPLLARIRCGFMLAAYVVVPLAIVVVSTIQHAAVETTLGRLAYLPFLLIASILECVYRFRDRKPERRIGASDGPGVEKGGKGCDQER